MLRVVLGDRTNSMNHESCTSVEAMKQQTSGLETQNVSFQSQSTVPMQRLSTDSVSFLASLRRVHSLS